MSAVGETHAETHAHGPHRNYVRIWAVLLVLLVVSVAGPFAGIRVVTLITAFGIALVKAYMVAKNFMHLDVEKPLVHWLLGAALALMVLLYAGLAPDVEKHKGRNWKKTYTPQTAPAEHGAKGHDSGGH
jgi:caa(3)-type oxidase subunit IV